MKKLICLICAAALLFSLYACGKASSREPGGADPGEKAEEPEVGRLSAFYKKYLKGDYTARISMNGQDVLYAVSKDGVYASTELAGRSTVVLSTDAYYLLDPEKMTGYKLPKDGEYSLYEPFASLPDFKNYIAAEGEIYGETLYFEDYTNEEEGVSTCYYFDGPMLKYIVTNYDVKNPVELLEIQKGADKELFRLPEGYAVTDADSLPGEDG